MLLQPAGAVERSSTTTASCLLLSSRAPLRLALALAWPALWRPSLEPWLLPSLEEPPWLVPLRVPWPGPEQLSQVLSLGPRPPWLGLWLPELQQPSLL